MKTKLLLFAVCALVSVGLGQWRETTVLLPDSLGGLGVRGASSTTLPTTPSTLAADRGQCVVAIDGTSNERVARIPTGSDVVALCYNPQNNKVYCANSGRATT